MIVEKTAKNFRGSYFLPHPVCVCRMVFFVSTTVQLAFNSCSFAL